MASSSRKVPTCSHWGNYLVETDGEQLLSVENYAVDKEPTLIGQSLLDGLDAGARIPKPMVREGYLKLGRDSDRTGRGKEAFVPVSWEVALDLAADALQHSKEAYGNPSIYGSSYGWSSAGRFHHAQSQVHGFLALNGGYTHSVNTYSSAAAEVITAHVLGVPFMQLVREAPTPEEVAEHAKTMVLFGGAAIKNTQVNAGGIGSHNPREQLAKIKAAGVDIINVSPIRDDVIDELDSQWLACRPGSDVAIMLALAHTVYTEGLHDQDFLDKYTVGFEKFLPYLLGESDGQPKDVEWAAALSDIPAERLRELGLQLGKDPSVLGISWSLQRQEYGEQTYWMFTTLAVMLGHIGKKGAGVAYGYGCIHNMGFGGRRAPNYRMGAFSIDKEHLPSYKEPSRKERSYIPVARHTDMLNHPGEKYVYNGKELTYPEIKCIYWAGGNPFHHHQDLNELRKAWAKPDCIIVNESVWTATARHADIVFPTTTMLERNDIGGSSYDAYISPMLKAVEPFGESRSDFDIFSELSKRLGFKEKFTKGRTEMEWVQDIYETTRNSAAENHVDLPDFETFWSGEQIFVGDQIPDLVFKLEKFRDDPETNALRTPSGKIEIFSEEIASFAYDDCVGHPCWYEHAEWLGGERAKTYPMHLVSNQPKTRLHSQFDHGRTSRDYKIKGRERARMNASEAAKRGIEDGDIIRLYNDRGACLAGVEISDAIRDQVIELPTGAWFDPREIEGADLEVHGNPNVLTADKGTSSLAQGCSAHSCLVEVEKFVGEAPEVKVFRQPEITEKE